MLWSYMFGRKSVTTKDDVRIMSDLYDARVRQVDDYFADLIRVIAKETDLDDTLVILTSDHGENLGEHGLLDHQLCVYDTLVHVPLIVRWPRALRPQRIDRLVQTCDIFPTVLACAGAKASQSATVMARPLIPLTRGESRQDDRIVLAEYLHWPERHLNEVRTVDPDFDPSPWRVSYRAIFDERWKLILSSRRRLDLYDLFNDPQENDNLALSNPLKTDQLALRVGKWLTSFHPFDPNQSSAPRDPLIPAGQRERLRDLGYVQ
jgi:arylsulfatase A-like enzyme